MDGGRTEEKVRSSCRLSPPVPSLGPLLGAVSLAVPGLQGWFKGQASQTTEQGANMCRALEMQ